MKAAGKHFTRPGIPRSTLLAEFGESLEFDKELAPLTSFKTGGAARYFMLAKTVSDVVRGIGAASRLGLDVFTIGGGSNLLVSDLGYDGLVIKIAIGGMKVIDKTEIECGAGEDLKALVTFAAENSLSGLEFAAGIWGTVGGAICGNAGAYGGEIGSVVSQVVLVERSGNLKTVGCEYCRFGYRDSHLKETGEIVANARFKLEKEDAVIVKGRVDDILADRSDKFPTDGMSAGCFFKNIPDPNEKHGKLPAGRLLEQVGAKQMSVGGSRVYQKHANIIVNSGTATSKDIRNLADKMKEKVYDQFGIRLEEEVTQIGPF